MIDSKSKWYTTTDAAEKFGRCQSRIRQVCIQHDIGTLVEGRVRLLSRRDLQRIGTIFRKLEDRG